MHVHILGICGTLMGSIALLARQQGHTVSGSDEGTYPPMSDQLADAGIEVNSPYSRENISKDVDLVMVGNANLPRGNPALEYVLEQNIPYTSGAEWLGRYLLHDKWVLAVAGTHGKTTTTSMLAWILEFAGLKPGFLVGGIPINFGESSRLGETPFFVIEADEYDTSYFDRRSKFLHYRPKTLILNNLEYDHADIFPNLAAIQYQFHHLIRAIPKNGLIIRPEDDKNLQTVIDQGCWSEQCLLGDNGKLNAIKQSQDGSHFTIQLDGIDCADVQWALTGQHNINNALAAVAAARHVGITPLVSCQALSGFKGVKRRMEKIYTSKTLTVYDDFAHHPTAIATTLDGLRHNVGNEKILAIIESGSHTMRLGTHKANLKTATQLADKTYWLQPEKTKWGMQSQISDDKNDVFTSVNDIFIETMKQIKSQQFQHIVIMSNGSFSGLHKRITATITAS